MSTRFIGLFIGIIATMSMPNCRAIICPLAQSVERIHGKEKPGGLPPRPVTSRNSHSCRSMATIAFGSSGSDRQQLASAGENADEFLIPNRTDCLAFLSPGLSRGHGQQDGSALHTLQPVPGGRDLQVVVLTKLPALLARHQPHPALQDLQRRCPRAVAFG